MIELKANSPCENLLPLDAGDVRISEVVIPTESLWEYPEAEHSIGYLRQISLEKPSSGGIDQSDCWIQLRVSGSARFDLLARLCPVEIGNEIVIFTSLLGHILVHYWVHQDHIDIWVPRSMVRSAIQDLERAAKALKGRNALPG